MKKIEMKDAKNSVGFKIEISTEGFSNSKFAKYSNLLMGSLGIYAESKADRIILMGFHENEEDVRRELKGYDILKLTRYQDASPFILCVVSIN